MKYIFISMEHIFIMITGLFLLMVFCFGCYVTLYILVLGLCMGVGDNMFKRIYLWFGWSRYLRCKHCCLFCKYYDECVNEIKDMEDKLDFKTYFD